MGLFFYDNYMKIFKRIGGDVALVYFWFIDCLLALNFCSIVFLNAIILSFVRCLTFLWYVRYIYDESKMNKDLKQKDGFVFALQNTVIYHSNLAMVMILTLWSSN